MFPFSPRIPDAIDRLVRMGENGPAPIMSMYGSVSSSPKVAGHATKSFSDLVSPFSLFFAFAREGGQRMKRLSPVVHSKTVLKSAKSIETSFALWRMYW